MHKNTSMPGTAAAALAAGLALVGCGSSASSSGSTASHSAATQAATHGAAVTGAAVPSPGTVTSASVPFPVGLGNTWTYKITASGVSSTGINKMTAVTPVPGGRQVTMTSTDRRVLGTTTSSREILMFRSDGSIGYPPGGFMPSSAVSLTGNGVVWPPASVIDSGKPTQSAVKLSIKAAGLTISATAHITVQGAGTATVTVPAGTYQATVVVATERLSVEGFAVTAQVKTWLAPGVGPVKMVTEEAGATSLTVDEELVSFTKG